MSYLAFNTRERDVHVRGWERHRLPGICQDMAWGLMGATPASPALDRLALLMPEGHPADTPDRGPGWAAQWAQTYRLFFTQDADNLITYKGHPVGTTGLILNTVLALGSGPMKLAARFAGQSYSHAWIPGKDRGWAADLITEGIVTDVFRHKIKYTDPSSIAAGDPVVRWDRSGWDQVIQLLRETDRGPVVLSVSTGDDFPDMYELGVPADAEDEMEIDQVWDLAELWLINRHQGHKISRDQFQEYRFDHRLTVFDVLATDYEDRLDRAIKEKRI